MACLRGIKNRKQAGEKGRRKMIDKKAGKMSLAEMEVVAGGNNAENLYMLKKLQEMGFNMKISRVSISNGKTLARFLKRHGFSGNIYVQVDCKNEYFGKDKSRFMSGEQVLAAIKNEDCIDSNDF